MLRVSGLLESAEANGLPFGLLILVNGICALTYRRLPGPRVWFAMCIAAAIVVLSALPTPAYEQYFCVAVPFLIVGAVSFAWNIARSRAGRLALLVVLLANLSFLGFDLRRYTSTGTGLIGLLPPTTAADWRLQSVRDISRELDRQTQPGDAVLSLWPGYLFESHAVCIPGMETHVGLSIAGKLTAAQLTRYRILSAADIEAGLKLHKRCLAVVGNQESMLVGGAPFERMLHLHGYRVSHRLGHTSIYTCN